MKTGKYGLLFLMVSIGEMAYAGSGNAADGLIFILMLTGILSVITAIFFLIDFLKKNTGLIIQDVTRWSRMIIKKVRDFFNDFLIPCVSNHFRTIQDVK